MNIIFLKMYVTMETIPIEMFYYICSFLDNKDLCRLRLLSKEYNTFILNYSFNNDIRLETEKQYKSFILYLKNNINKIKVCIQLRSYYINSINFNSKLKYFKNCTILNLSYCHNITDEGLKYLSNYTTLDLSCLKITDDGLKYLSNCRSLKLYNCNITDKGLKYLSNCKDFKLYRCNISEEYIQFLRDKGLKVYHC